MCGKVLRVGKKDVEQFFRVSTLRVDHSFKEEELEKMGVLSKVCQRQTRSLATCVNSAHSARHTFRRKRTLPHHMRVSRTAQRHLCTSQKSRHSLHGAPHRHVIVRLDQCTVIWRICTPPPACGDDKSGQRACEKSRRQSQCCRRGHRHGRETPQRDQVCCKFGDIEWWKHGSIFNAKARAVPE